MECWTKLLCYCLKDQLQWIFCKRCVSTVFDTYLLSIGSSMWPRPNVELVDWGLSSLLSSMLVWSNWMKPIQCLNLTFSLIPYWALWNLWNLLNFKYYIQFFVGKILLRKIMILTKLWSTTHANVVQTFHPVDLQVILLKFFIL